MSEIIQANNLGFSFIQQQQQVEIFSQAQFTINQADQIALLGRSGSGKSSLLYLLAGLLEVEEGQVKVKGQDIKDFKKPQLLKFRNQHLGFVFQFHHLLPDLTVLDNVQLPALISGTSLKEAQQSATTLLQQVGLADKLASYPSQLSGGERQRVAIARAMVNKPSLILADEPTGNLDPQTSQLIVELLFELRHQYQMALLMVTHDIQLANSLNQQWLLSQKRLHTNLTKEQINQQLLQQ